MKESKELNEWEKLMSMGQRFKIVEMAIVSKGLKSQCNSQVSQLTSLTSQF